MWRGDGSQERATEFDCVYCKLKGRIKSRVCFLEKEIIHGRFPLISEDNRLSGFVKTIVRKSDFIDLIVRLSRMFPTESVFDIVMRKQYTRIGERGQPVCPISLFNQELDFLVSLESAASEYHVMPFNGGYLDQPSIIIDAFDCIRSARYRYIRDKNKEISKTAKK